jgi:hypothetical protein
VQQKSFSFVSFRFFIKTASQTGLFDLEARWGVVVVCFFFIFFGPNKAMGENG